MTLGADVNHESAGLLDDVPEIGRGADNGMDRARLALHHEERGNGETDPGFVTRGDDGDRCTESSPESADRVPCVRVVNEGIVVVDHCPNQVRFLV